MISLSLELDMPLGLEFGLAHKFLIANEEAPCIICKIYNVYVSLTSMKCCITYRGKYL